MPPASKLLCVSVSFCLIAAACAHRDCQSIKHQCAVKNNTLQAAYAHHLKQNHVLIVVFQQYMGLNNQLVHLRNALIAAFKFQAVVILSDMNCASDVVGSKCHPRYIIDFDNLKALCSKHNVTLVYQSVPVDRAAQADCVIPRPFTLHSLNHYRFCIAQQKHRLVITSDFLEMEPKSFSQHIYETRLFDEITKPSSYIKSIVATIDGLIADTTGCDTVSGDYIALHGRWEETNIRWWSPNMTDSQLWARQAELASDLATGLAKIIDSSPQAASCKCVYVSTGDPEPIKLLKEKFPLLTFLTKDDIVGRNHSLLPDDIDQDIFTELKINNYVSGNPLNMLSAFVDYLIFKRSAVAVMWHGGSFARQQILSRCLIDRKPSYIVDASGGHLLNCSETKSAFMGLPQEFLGR